ncbi:GNAT family N-acetyltransferase [Halobacteriales archaeon QS_1_68_17]|nr:MAG: GNAT family N-acetyltransferase [Halobacteriales archaeon QS_1_68_17]
MDIREASPDDRDVLRRIAKRSLEASYSLSPQTIESAVRQWYSGESFVETIRDDDVLVLVVERGNEVVGFSQAVVVAEGEEGDLHWLHVHPDHRGEGLGQELFERARERLDEMGAAYLRGRVLEDNQAGNAFYESQGFEYVDQEEVEIDGRTYLENIYLESDPAQLRTVVTDRGDTVYVDISDEEQGSNSPFHVVYSDPDREDRYGYYCTRCDRLANAMDAMGRIECDNCGNVRQPTRWDSAYM